MATTQATEELMGIISSISPLERELAGQHPRLHGGEAWWQAMRAKLDQQPWAGFWARVLRVADAELKRPVPKEYDSNRWWGSRLPMIAMAFRFTGDRRYFELVRRQVLMQSAQAEREPSLSGGHTLYGTSVCYDWLYHEFTEEERAIIRKGLQYRAQGMYDVIRDPGAWQGTIYTCNHFPVCLTGLVAAGGALYGEVPGVSAWMRLAIEKARLTKQALGPDGASQEGIGYGQYYLEFYLVLLDLLRGLTGEDLFADHEFLKNTAKFHLYSSQCRNSWVERAWLICLGDGVRYAWYGPDYMMRLLASEYGDGVAQWFANETEASGVTREQAPHLAMFWNDETLTPVHAATLPAMHHFKDQDLVLGRSGWHGDEHVYAFKCGPHFGHHALKHYSLDIGGGHMHPDAGHLVILAGGDALLSEDEYPFKMTSYHNTVLVNGIGQTGEGVEWFEGTELRHQKRGPRILSATHSPEQDVIVADVAPAYELTAKLTRFVRRVIYARPSVWIVVDELAAETPSTFEQYWHSDFAFETLSERVFAARGKQSWMRVTSLAPQAVTTRTFIQEILYIDQKGRQPDLAALVIANTAPAASTKFVTVIEVFTPEDVISDAPRMDGNAVVVGERRVSVG